MTSERRLFEEETEEGGGLTGGEILCEGKYHRMGIGDDLQIGQRAVGTWLECHRIASQGRIEVEKSDRKRYWSHSRSPTRSHVSHGSFAHKSLLFVPERLWVRMFQLSCRKSRNVMTFLEIIEDHRRLNFIVINSLHAADAPT